MHVLVCIVLAFTSIMCVYFVCTLTAISISVCWYTAILFIHTNQVPEAYIIMLLINTFFKIPQHMASNLGVLTVGVALAVVLLALPMTAGETLHVRPTSTNTSCLTHPCHTLSEYAQDPGQYFNESNLTLHFLPGDHILDVNLDVRTIYQLKILATSNAVVPTRVICSINVGFMLTNITEMRINSIDLVSCARSQVGYFHETTYYGLYLQSVQMAEIIDCTFQDSYGSALGVVDSHVVLRGNNSFLNNCRMCSNGSCYQFSCFGGGVFVHMSNLSFTGSSSFIGNSASNGGGVGVVSNSNVNITGNTTFRYNSARNGGGFYSQSNNNVNINGKTAFINNSASSGGGVYVESYSSVEISGNTTFVGNTASHGGGVNALSNSHVNISGNTTFLRNSATNSGGGIHIEQNSKLKIGGNTTFIGNSAANDGGGVSAGSGSKVNISGNTTFLGNSATNGGGGVYAEQNSNVDISGNTQFISNLANVDGGGVSSGSSSNVNVNRNTRSTFNGNRAGSNSGLTLADLLGADILGVTVESLGIDFRLPRIDESIRIYPNEPVNHNVSDEVHGRSNSNVKIRGNASFIGNSARYGGGVSAWSKCNVDISENATFVGNSAVVDGGGIYLQYYSSVNISGDIDLIGNSASGNGGGIHAWNSSNVDIAGNTTFTSNSGRFGGGVSAWSNSDVDISGSTRFISNSASIDGGGISLGSNSNVKIYGNTQFTGNDATVDGGGVSIRSSSNLGISGNVTFTSNSAGDGGGAVSSETGSNVRISGNSKFSSNSARVGGCIFIDTVQINTTTNLNAVVVQISNMDYVSHETFLSLAGNGNFTNCSATNQGGAVYAKDTQVNINGINIFRANRAQFGGGLYADKSSLNFPGDNTFTDNMVGSKGGGIYVQESNMSFSGTGLLSNNVAQLDGGGIYADGSNSYFNGNITIINNTAQLGGGVYLDNNTFKMDGHNVIERNVATYYGGGIYIRRTLFNHTGYNMFIANSAEDGGGIYVIANSTLSLDGMNTFMANKALVSGGGIWLDNSNLDLDGSNHFVECAASYEGGAIFTYAATASLTGNNTFESNSATTGGGIHARWSNIHVTNSINFEYNIALFGGGVFMDNSTFEFNGSSIFHSNQANYTGGSIYASKSGLIFIGSSSIVTNHAARDGGGIYARDGCVIHLLGFSNYWGNSADYTGGGISVYQSNINLGGQSKFCNNKALEGGGLFIFKCAVNILGENNFIANSATNHGGAFAVMRSTLHLNGSTTFKNNTATSGGGVYISDTTVDSDGSNCFMNNTAQSEGGGIYVRKSKVEFNGSDVFVANFARNKGAAIHTSFTTLIFQGSSHFVNNSAKFGGGIHFEGSNLTVAHHGSSHHSQISPSSTNFKICYAASNLQDSSFVNNMALQGGALYFDVNSNFSVHQLAYVHFQDNNATAFGGVIYVEDAPSRSECFFHTQSLDFNTTLLVFVNNSAGIRGSVLYGGLLEKCNSTSDRYKSVLEFFNMSILQRNDDSSHSISSDPIQLCFCNNNQINCTELSQSRNIYPGQQVEVSVIAIDQAGSAIPALINTTIRSGHILNVSETISYGTEGNCTGRRYFITPRTVFTQLDFYPSSRSVSTLHLTVNVTFESCPIGFEQSNFTGECICDHRIWQYTNSCDIDRQAILRNASTTFWLGVWYNNGMPVGFIHHNYCPRNYCISKSKYINLSNPDQICNFNRSGLLCGRCKEGLSLVLGSSQCKQCSNSYLALLVPFALAGILLVILLFLLHLTVAAGTLHGLIFYANIVQANHHIFFPQSSNNPVSIFIAWLNLDLGIQTCFYNGLDAYAKTWLEFGFPIYVWVIVGFLVFICRHSTTLTTLLGKKQVPVLTTLFLFSYAKVLRTIITALSLTILHYPHNNTPVWVHDANVPLAMYIPLVLVALLFLLFLFLPYTLLLLLGQWRFSKKRCHCLLAWVQSLAVKYVLDSYHAPYKNKHRYWTGLLLLLRCALFLVFAFNIRGDDSINLLVISSATSGIFIWFALSGMVYKSLYLNVLELSFILNLDTLAVATYHVNHSGGSQAAVAYTSVGIAFLTFVGIVIYHIYIRIAKLQCIHGNQLHQCCGNRENNGNPQQPCVVIPNTNTEHNPRNRSEVPCTVVDLDELRSPLELLPNVVPS